MDQGNGFNQPEHRGGDPAEGATQPLPARAAASSRFANRFASRFASRRGKVLRWSAGVAAAVLLTAGGVIAGLDLSGGPAQGGQGSVLNAALSGTGGTLGSDGTVSGTVSGTASAANSSHVSGLRLRRVVRIVRHLRGIHGQFTVLRRDGEFRELAFERGVIVAVNGSDMTVRAADGTTWTWALSSRTIVVRDWARTMPSSLAAGDRLFVGGPLTGSVRDARLIVVRKNWHTGQPAS